MSQHIVQDFVIMRLCRYRQGVAHGENIDVG
jgi:hypothetical protein